MGLFLILVLLMPVLTAAKAPCGEVTVHHLFTHALIAHPDVAFAPRNSMAKSYDTDCLTPKEFKRILQSLYERKFRLIDPMSLYEKSGRGVKQSALSDFPKGYKPLVLSFDDINYYRKKMHKGMADKLVLVDGKIGAYSRYAAESVAYDNDVIPLVELFLREHPDFAFRGARGMINLTGFDGVFGYRTDRNSVNRSEEIESVRPLIARLKQLGWRMASHSYGHYHMNKITDEKFMDDAKKWQNEVESLVGKTPFYVYPYGEFEKQILQDKATAKHKRLLNQGFRVFFGVGGKSFFKTLHVGGVSQLFMDRVPMDGNTMRRNRRVLAPYFDVEQVYDTARPLPLNNGK